MIEKGGHAIQYDGHHSTKKLQSSFNKIPFNNMAI